MPNITTNYAITYTIWGYANQFWFELKGGFEISEVNCSV